jgi:hypothetical protein
LLRELLPLGVIPELTEVERHTRLIPGDLGVMARRDREYVARANLQLGPVVRPEMQ